MTEDRNLVSVKDMAKALSVPPSWLYEKVRHKDCPIPHVRVGKKYVRFNVNEVLEYFRSVKDSN